MEEKKSSAQTGADQEKLKDNSSSESQGGKNITVTDKPAAQAVARSVYGMRKKTSRNNRFGKKDEKDEYGQQIIDIARVTRVMAGGKRMRFRVCIGIGNKKGEVAIGLAKGADVSAAVTKAVNKAKKNIIKVPIDKGTIPHEIYQKLGAAKILLKPASQGKGVIAGGAVRIILELAGIKNITSKILGTNNKVNNVKCVIEALKNLKKVNRSNKKNDLPVKTADNK